MLEPEQQTRESPGAGLPLLARQRRLRITAVAVWTLLLASFWFLSREAEGGPVEFFLSSVQQVSELTWAPLGLLALYLLRPILLLPITLLNLATGLLLGPAAGIPLAMAGTLISASAGYGIGRSIGPPELAERLSTRWPFVRMLRQRSFEAVVAGGLMYLHADLVNLPAGMFRIRFPTFLLAITLGNSLTLTMAVLAGSSVQGSLSNVSLTVDLEYLFVAAALFVVSLTVAQILRGRIQPKEP